MQRGIVYFPDSTNIGDDIQTYAASLLVDNPVFCNREKLDEINDSTRLLCNGWFLEEANHWPPSHHIQTLFLSFHISNKNKIAMTSGKALAYYKLHEPIGCRDYNTLEILQKHNIDAYFSGCLTLTIPKYEGLRGNEIIFADVLRSNYTKNYRKTIVDRMIPEKYRDEISFVSHISKNLKTLDVTDRMNNVEQILNRYAKAKVVFTSLIHCALPCIALGTPVIFIDFGFNNNKDKRDRFNGILDLFKVESNIRAPFMERNLAGRLGRGLGLYHFNKHKLTPLNEEFFEFSETTMNHLELAEKMKVRVNEYFKG